MSVPISHLPTAAALEGPEMLPIVRNGVTRKTTIQAILELLSPQEVGGWNVVEFPNGFAVLRKVISFSGAACTNAWGQMYTSNAATIPAQTFPAVFATIPSIDATPIVGSGSYWLILFGSATTAKSTSYQIGRATTQSNMSGSVSMTVSGFLA